MLVVTRKTNESIVIGDAITVTVLGVRGKRVRIGIEAPSATTRKRGFMKTENWVSPVNPRF